MTIKRIEIMIGLILMAFSILILSIASQFPKGLGHDVGARFFPNFYAYLLIGLSVLYILTSLYKVREEEKKHGNKEWIKAIVGMICTFAYFFLMEFTGFLIATPVFLAGMMWIFNYRKPIRIIVFTALITAAIYVVFSILLKVPLPSGNLFS
ncbi:tripartite tricarboxylate transporter TctB family protein [Cytobacillus depressus]|uniref:Tripartite tricarboxylate transporter TctB family protein n=1 Tax=Cytobacillus depressus TaxID=1602942 RepID=A0A6L3UZ36_9BACI|nr:tripartite tricarboxylate transporter TctB family protein [Cytobacillus depressus]KAB2329564.1 tripartite tricarboxylate transporter TctB family protein [Cytobacillus depressus]